MWTLWVLTIMSSIQAGTFDLLESTPALGSLPAVPQPLTLPLNLPSSSGLKTSSTKRVPPPQKRPVPSKGGKCAPVVRYFVSSNKIEEYLMNTLPPQIEQMVTCEEIELGGVLGTVLSTVDKADLLSTLDISSLLSVGGGLGLNGLLGNGGDGGSAKKPSLSKATAGLGQLLPGGQEGLGRVLSLGGDKGTGKGLLDGEGLSNLQKPLDDVVGKVGDVKESAQDVVKDVLPSSVKDPVSDLLNIKTQELLLTVQGATVDSTEITIEDDEIHVHSEATATIGGQGALGPAISLLGFGAKMGVTLKIGISSNNTQCVTLEVQDKHIQINQVTIQLVETLEGTLPLPVPLPLSDVISTVMTVQINENLKNSSSCAIVLSDFNDCKNTTGLFKYKVQSAKISPKGLAVFYCAEVVLGKNTVPVPGGRLPPDSKPANISLTMSNMMYKQLITYAAKQSSVKMNDLEANVTKVVYAFQKNGSLRAFYGVDIKKDGESYATGKTKLTISHASKISKTKMKAVLKMSPHLLQKGDAEGILPELLKKFWSIINELLKQVNVPEGVSSYTLRDAIVKSLKSNDLQAAN
uniref:Vomeromodulin-like n=1 Tax=Nannospalax galili TaxID=1026970 RepID=A0A8C6RGF7_NANGA